MSVSQPEKLLDEMESAYHAQGFETEHRGPGVLTLSRDAPRPSESLASELRKLQAADRKARKAQLRHLRSLMLLAWLTSVLAAMVVNLGSPGFIGTLTEFSKYALGGLIGLGAGWLMLRLR